MTQKLSAKRIARLREHADLLERRAKHSMLSARIRVNARLALELGLPVKQKVLDLLEKDPSLSLSPMYDLSVYIEAVKSYGDSEAQRPLDEGPEAQAPDNPFLPDIQPPQD